MHSQDNSFKKSVQDNKTSNSWLIKDICYLIARDYELMRSKTGFGEGYIIPVENSLDMINQFRDFR